MKKQIDGENILVVGFYRTGLHVANFLIDRGFNVKISDTKTENQLQDQLAKLRGKPDKVFTGKQTFEQLENIDRVILSPGVPRAIPLIQEAYKRQIPVWSEIQLAYNYLPDNLKIIGVTGTDGKSTTVSLIHEILKTKYNSFLCGNIGTPVISVVDKIKSEDVLILELSSYQLEDNESFKCDIACILNVSKDHLDRYPSFEDYMKAKENILLMQDKNGIAVLNEDSEFFERQKEISKGEIVSFSRINKKSSITIDNNIIKYNKSNICNINMIKLKGIHNLENVLCSVAVAEIMDVDNNSIAKVLSEYKGLPHRNEFVDTVNGVDFVNDSKATTINSVCKAIQSQNKQIILLLGGRDKGLDFSELNPFLKDKVKDIVLFGEARDKIASEISNGKKYDKVKNFKDAVIKAFEKAEKNNVVLLSPGCTSWDEFSSYEERGDVFKKIVMELK